VEKIVSMSEYYNWFDYKKPQNVCISNPIINYNVR